MKTKVTGEPGLIYDYVRDGHINLGETLYIMADGTRRLVRGKKKTNGSVEENADSERERRPVAQRARVSIGIKRNEKDTRLSAPGKRATGVLVHPDRPNVFNKRNIRMDKKEHCQGELELVFT